MAQSTYGKMGIARMFALTLGIGYAGVGILELFYGAEDPLAIGETVIIAGATLHTITHLAVGIVALGAFFAGEAASKSGSRVLGVAFLIVLLLNFLATDFYAELMGFPDGYGLPGIYYLAHAMIALGGLFAGFVVGRSRSTAAA